MASPRATIREQISPGSRREGDLPKGTQHVNARKPEGLVPEGKTGLRPEGPLGMTEVTCLTLTSAILFASSLPGQSGSYISCRHSFSFLEASCMAVGQKGHAAARATGRQRRRQGRDREGHPCPHLEGPGGMWVPTASTYSSTTNPGPHPSSAPISFMWQRPLNVP